jgi:hypothetical protein
MFRTLVLMGTWGLSECVVGVSDHLCVLMGEMGCFEFWSFYVDTDVVRVYAADADGQVSSCLCGLSENKLRLY